MLILVFIAFVFVGIGVVIAIFISWTKDFKNRNQPKIDDRDPIIIAIENCQTREELPDFCIMLQNLPPSFSEKYFGFMSVLFFGAVIFFMTYLQGDLKVLLTLKTSVFFIIIVYLLKHWNDLTNEHNERLTNHQELGNPHLEINHNGIIYFDGIETFGGWVGHYWHCKTRRKPIFQRRYYHRNQYSIY